MNYSVTSSVAKGSRIDSIDIVRGFIMVIMALDHCRVYFHIGAFGGNDPTNLATTTPILFFTRFITHYCAPLFIFLAGTSAYLYGKNKSKSDLTRFLLTRGLWMIFVEIVINNFFWWFDIHYGFVNLQVLWAIGFSMITLSFLIHLPIRIILLFSIIVIAGHNLLDGIVAEGYSFLSILWYILHQFSEIPVSHNLMIGIYYPVMPWFAVMSAGYCFGQLFNAGFSPILRQKYLLNIGLVATGLFILLRGINVYGDPQPWAIQNDSFFTMLSFLKVSKYPPSLLFLLITLGPGMIMLFIAEKWKTKISSFFLVFGRVPFFYYLIHILVIHLSAMVIWAIMGGKWTDLLLNHDTLANGKLSNYGYPLWVVYLAWISIILFLFPFCKKYMIYKFNHKEKWWLSYL